MHLNGRCKRAAGLGLSSTIKPVSTLVIDTGVQLYLRIGVQLFPVQCIILIWPVVGSAYRHNVALQLTFFIYIINKSQLLIFPMKDIKIIIFEKSTLKHTNR